MAYALCARVQHRRCRDAEIGIERDDRVDDGDDREPCLVGVDCRPQELQLADKAGQRREPEQRQERQDETRGPPRMGPAEPGEGGDVDGPALPLHRLDDGEGGEVGGRVRHRVDSSAGRPWPDPCSAATPIKG
jgi:hypothetical protein